MIAEAFAGNHSIINYTMFVAVFAMLSLLYLIGAAIIESIAIPLALLALDAINTLLFLIGGIALAAYLGVHSCSNRVCLMRRMTSGNHSYLTALQGYVIDNKITNGSLNPSKRCREMQAVCAFLWFGFAAWAASLGLSALASRGGGTSGLRRGMSTTSIMYPDA